MRIRNEPGRTQFHRPTPTRSAAGAGDRVIAVSTGGAGGASSAGGSWGFMALVKTRKVERGTLTAYRFFVSGSRSEPERRARRVWRRPSLGARALTTSKFRASFPDRDVRHVERLSKQEKAMSHETSVQ